MSSSTSTTVELVESLRAEFPVDKVQQRIGSHGKKLDYISIDTVLNRLLDVYPDYDLEISYMDVRNQTSTNRDGEERTEWVAWCQVILRLDDKVAPGVGAMINTDIDMAVKSALSEAIKNAAKNGWGLALYLWDKEKLAEIAAERSERVSSNTPAPASAPDPHAPSSGRSLRR